MTEETKNADGEEVQPVFGWVLREAVAFLQEGQLENNPSSTIVHSHPNEAMGWTVPVYLDPPPVSELEDENARLKAILSKTIKALDVVFEDTQARTKAGMTYGIRGHPTLSIGTLHVVAQARFAARRVREGGKVE